MSEALRPGAHLSMPSTGNHALAGAVLRRAIALCALAALLSAAGAALGSVRSAGGDAYYEYLQGKIQRYSGDLAGAAEHLSQAAGVDDSSAIHTELAETYLRMGEIQKAIEQARIGTEKDPSSIAAHKMLVGAYLAQAQRSTDRSGPTAAAIAEMKKLVELSPADIDMRTSLGRLLLDTRPDEAIEQFRAAQELGGTLSSSACSSPAPC